LYHATLNNYTCIVPKTQILYIHTNKALISISLALRQTTAFIVTAQIGTWAIMWTELPQI